MSVRASDELTRSASPVTGRPGEYVRRARAAMRAPSMRLVRLKRRLRTIPPSIEVDTPVLVVSPHLDDAVLSSFAFLQRRRTTVLTVFTGSPERTAASDWDRGLGHDDAVEIMQTRLAEDDRALASLPVDTVRLPLLENGYRTAEISDADVATMREVVREWFESTDRRGVVLAPSGAGANDNLIYRRRWNTSLPLVRVPGGGVPHPDHCVVRDEIVDEALSLGAGVVVYEELPYRWTGRGARFVKRLAQEHGCTASRFDVDIDRDRKAFAVGCYASQTHGLFRPWVRDIRSVMPRYERFWTLAPAR